MSEHAINAGLDQDSIRLVEQLVDFSGPPEQFLVEMLAGHCRGVGAMAAGLLRIGEDGRIAVAATHPPLAPQQTPDWLRNAFEELGSGKPLNQATVRPVHSSGDLYGQAAREHVLILPLRRGGRMRGAAAYHLLTEDPQTIEHAREQLSWAVGLLSLYELRLTLDQQRSARRSLESAQQILAEVNKRGKFKDGAMTFCNEVASRCDAHRVGLGFLRGKYIKAIALSHTEKFTRKMRVVQDLEAAMEESLDQDAEVVYPAPDQATVVCRAASEFARQHGPLSVVSLPIRFEGEPVAVMTMEREAERPWTWTEVALARLICELCAARLVDRHERDRFIAIRAANQTRKGLATMLGPRHTWMKLAALAVLAVVIFLTFAKGTYRVDAPFVIEAVDQRSIPSPFDGQLDQAFVKPGDQVVAGVTVLAQLRTEDIELELNAARMEQRRHEREADLAMRQGKQAERLMALARADETTANVELLEYRLARSRIVAPIDGVVLEGEYHKTNGAPVNKGDVLFEIAPLDALRATMMVPEDRVMALIDHGAGEGPGVVAKPLVGQIATAASPGVYIPVKVESVSPVAEVIDQRNVFRVHATLQSDEQTTPLRPGMEGLAKVDIERRRYAWIWSREMINWIRMKLWL